MQTRPNQKEVIEAAYTAAITKLPEAGRERGVKLGSAAAQAVITARKVDTEPVESYRPLTTAGKRPDRGAVRRHRRFAQTMGAR
jgi:hypothetical protein